MTTPTTTLTGGDDLPVVGMGTYKLQGDQARESVTAALEAGYRHVDTAEGYFNEAEVGETIAAADVDREDVFVTSKVLAKHLAYDSVIESCEATLEQLGTDYLDLYLIHWPNPAVSIRETLDAMATLHDRGLVRSVGVSNFSRYQLSAALHVTDVPIAVNQIEYHPWFQRPKLVDYCQSEDVTVEAAAPLARTDVLADPTVRELADAYGKTPAQIVLRWAIEDDVVVLPRSRSAEHIQENVDLFGFELDPADHDRLDELDRDDPVYDTRARSWDSDVWGIAE
jgi:diketogulonate reductase-like aldo/keto reductase